MGREGQAGPGRRLPWHQDEDHVRAEEDRLVHEQAWQDREQEGERKREEAVRRHQGLARRGDKGAEGARREGLLRDQEGHAPVQEGEGVLRALSAILGDARSSGMWGSPASCLSDGQPLSSDSAVIESVYAHSTLWK